MNQTIAAGIAGTAVPQAVPSTDDPRVVTARRVFRGALAFNTALTLFWLVSMATDSRFFFADYRLTGEASLNVFGMVVGFYLIPGFFWWGIKSLRCGWVGFTKEERRDAFSSRMDRPYDVATLTAKYSERRDPHRRHGRPPRPLRDPRVRWPVRPLHAGSEESAAELRRLASRRPTCSRACSAAGSSSASST